MREKTMTVDVYTDHGVAYYLDTLDAPDGAKIRHAATAERPATFPGNWTLLWNAFMLMCLQIRAGYEAAKVEFLEQVEPARLRFWFVVHWVHYMAPARIERAAKTVVKVAQDEEAHKSVRRTMITVLYVLGTTAAIAVAPKLIFVVWMM